MIFGLEREPNMLAVDQDPRMEEVIEQLQSMCSCWSCSLQTREIRMDSPGLVFLMNLAFVTGSSILKYKNGKYRWSRISNVNLILPHKPHNKSAPPQSSIPRNKYPQGPYFDNPVRVLLCCLIVL